ncbi:MAG: hypothetical protein EOO20_00975 [Chryseobacterium sp.]|nr:MAG: hypothetical protein EOO20_00975 [Chryseobacterium sp.]
MKVPYQISLNQIVEFSTASAAKRVSIAKQQLVVNPFLIPWYQLAKQRIKKYFHNTQQNQPLVDAIDILKKRIPVSKRQETDRNVSIEALRRILAMRIPSFLGELDYQVVKVDKKSIDVGDVVININPDVVIKAKIGGKVVYGGLKVHLSKNKPFDLSQCYSVASMVHVFLSKEVAEHGELVSPELCFCLDVFGGRLVNSPMEYSTQATKMKVACNEFKKIWDEVNIE